jgi:hypothetical protein
MAAFHLNAATPDLKTANAFGLLASSGITNVDSGTTIKGSVGSAPATPAVTGITASMVVDGTLYLSPNAVTGQAQTDATAAYTSAAGEPCLPANNLTGQDLGGKTLVAGASNVYCFSSSAGLTGALTLSGGPSDVFIFQMGSTLISGSSASVVLTGGLSACNVFWQVGSSATLGVNTNFAGTILAKTSITLNGGTLLGRALANTGAVTISGKETVVSGCTVIPSIVLGPAASSSVCGSGATTLETATILSNGSPVVGTAVTFTIVSGPGAGTYGPFLTDVFGKASFSVPPLPLLSGPASVIAQFTDASSTTWTSNTTTVSCVAPANPDVTPPTLSLVTIVPGPPKQIIFSTQDTGSGLASVVVNISTNATVAIPTFVSGTTDTLGITATKIDQAANAVVMITATDVAGNVTVFDPVYATITIPPSRSRNVDLPYTVHFGGIPAIEGHILIRNGAPGVTRLVFKVNGKVFEANRLTDGVTRTLDIFSALHRGNNHIKVTAYGEPNSTVDILISEK